MAKKPTSIPENVPAVGSAAPDFALPADDGQTVRLSDCRGQRVVLYFYPKDDTPGCTAQACGFRDNYVEIAEKNAVVFGISPDGVKQPRQVPHEVQPAVPPAGRRGSQGSGAVRSVGREEHVREEVLRHHPIALRHR